MIIMIKNLFLFVFLICSFAAYGQDLIVTTTGDSLRCKIVEVTHEQIQFRFEQGRIIPIKRIEVASYQYNFKPAKPEPAKPVAATDRDIRQNVNADIITLQNGNEIKVKVMEITASEVKYKRFDNLDGPVIVVPKSEVFAINYENGTREVFNTVQQRETTQVANDHTKFYIGLVAGGVPDDVTTIGVNAAYFFNHQVGFGFAIHDGSLSDEYSSFETTFYGPVFYGHWGRRNGKFFFPTVLGIGAVRSYYEDNQYGSFSDSVISLGFLASAGVAFRPIKLISIGLNYEFGSDFEFLSWGIGGFTLSLNFHF